MSQNRAGDPFYSSPRWRRLRRARLEHDNYLCQEHLREGKVVEAREVDHVLPRETHPELEWEFDNLRSLCKACHSRKTMAEQRARRA